MTITDDIIDFGKGLIDFGGSITSTISTVGSFVLDIALEPIRLINAPFEALTGFGLGSLVDTFKPSNSLIIGDFFTPEVSNFKPTDKSSKKQNKAETIVEASATTTLRVEQDELVGGVTFEEILADKGIDIDQIVIEGDLPKGFERESTKVVKALSSKLNKGTNVKVISSESFSNEDGGSLDALFAASEKNTSTNGKVTVVFTENAQETKELKRRFAKSNPNKVLVSIEQLQSIDGNLDQAKGLADSVNSLSKKPTALKTIKLGIEIGETVGKELGVDINNPVVKDVGDSIAGLAQKVFGEQGAADFFNTSNDVIDVVNKGKKIKGVIDAGDNFVSKPGLNSAAQFGVKLGEAAAEQLEITPNSGIGKDVGDSFANGLQSVLGVDGTAFTLNAAADTVDFAAKVSEFSNSIVNGNLGRDAVIFVQKNFGS